MHRELAAQASIAIHAKFDDGEADVLCDRVRIQQIFSNLIGNALKFTPPDGSIVVSLQVVDDEARFSVADTGPGMAPEQLPHVFDRFWRAPGTARSGTGLGLAIAKGLAEAHGGTIWVESKVGRGTTFHFTIPLALPQEPPSERPSAPRSAKTVLVVDDDADTRELLGEILEGEGFEVAKAKNGREALAYLETSPAPASIVLDLQMPVMDGWSFLAARNESPAIRAIPVVVISAQRDIKRDASSANTTFVQKPIHGDRLIETIIDVSR
jgi:CheY-like chemotaxis protein